MFFRRRRPEFRGYLDGFRGDAIFGWVQDRQHPKVKQIIDIYHGDEVVGTACADQYRADLQAAGIADGCYGFSYHCSSQIKNIESFSAKVRDSSFWLLNDIPTQILADKVEKLINKPRRGLPILQPGLSNYFVHDNDIEIANEICHFWRDIKQNFASKLLSDSKSMWAHIIGERHKTLVHFLDRGKPRDLAEYLVNIHKKPESAGLFQGEQAYQDFLDASPNGRWSAVLPFHDMLASLSQYLGTFNLECDEQDVQGETIATRAEVLIAKIEKKIRCEIVPKINYDGLYGLHIGNKILHGRDIQALYLALRQSEVVQNQEAYICEIGAGFGMAAYYAWLIGQKYYCIIDLPTVCVLQYFTLRRLLPEVKIEVLREGQSLSAATAISIIPANYAESIQALKANLIVNVDSFPEMGQEICEAYFKKIPQWSPLLLSINQEANREITQNDNRQTIVSAMLHKASYRRQYRFRSWIRQGYAEELWLSPTLIS